jgi:RNA 3'-terminal phosphate cyclase (ATP)
VGHIHPTWEIRAEEGSRIVGGPSERTPLTLDGSHGEGGGQIVRTALSLAVARGRAVRLTSIRAGRPRPGLQPQHLAVVRALAAISDAEVRGDALDSTTLSFAPRGLRGGAYTFDVGAERASAGAVSLLCQALLLPLALARSPSRLTLIGGTHVPWSPPAHYLGDVFFPALRRIGVAATLDVRRWGWFPAGGGEIGVTVEPAREIGGFVAEPPAAAPVVKGLSAVSRLHRSIVERQRRRVEERLAAAGVACEIASVDDGTALGPGTLVFLAVPARAGFSALGRRGLPAERVADLAVDELLAYLASGAVVDDHLADQLVPFLALGVHASRFTCPTLSRHLETVAWTVRQLLPADIQLGRGRPTDVVITPGRES